MDIDIEIDGDSPEAVALALLRMVAEAEGRLDDDGMLVKADRAWLLDAYVECLAAVNGERLAAVTDDAEDDAEDDADGPQDDEEDEEDEEDEDGHEEDRPAASRRA